MATLTPLPPDPYKALGVGKEADALAIKTAYRKLVLKCHPDKVQDPALKAVKQDEFQRVRQAYELLSDDARRREYDNELNLKKLRDEFHKAMPHHSSTRAPPKNYYEYNVRTAEPPPSFRPGPPPAAAPRSPYHPSNGHFSASWEHEIPTRSKHIYDEERKPRRTASDENTRKDEESKEERRRRREKEELRREKEEARREKEEREKRRAEKEKERERKEREERKAREKEARIQEEKDRARREEERRARKEREKERERREKERDEIRRREQDQKTESKKSIYVEHHEESGEEERRVPKKKSSSEKQKQHDSPRRAKSSGRTASGEDLKAKTHSALDAAAEYMRISRRKGSGSGPGLYHEGAADWSESFPDPSRWHAAEKPSRSRRPSHDDKKFRATVEEEPEIVDASPKGPPPLRKAFTSPAGGMHNMANVSAPRGPGISRAHTDLRVPPTAPPAPAHEAARHSAKAERRQRRASLDAEDVYEEVRRSRAARPNIVRYKVDEEDVHHAPRVSHYRPTEEAYFSTPGGGTGGGVKFPKVKMAAYEKPYTTKYDEVSITPMESPYRSSGGGYASYGYVHAGG